MLEITLLGPLSLSADGAPVELPSSRKTRALLAYLLLTGRAHSRPALCELLWPTPHDPRAALRWSLTKLRPLVNGDGAERLSASRHSIFLDAADMRVDLHEIAALADDRAAPDAALAAAWTRASAPLLEDCELPSQIKYAAWLAQSRAELARLRARIARRLARSAALAPMERLDWVDRWLRDSPGDAAAIGEAGALRRTLTDAVAPAAPALALSPAPDQQVRHVRAHDGAAIAWAETGPAEAPVIVKAANWLSHLEHDWHAPIWSPLFRDLSRDHRMIRYDERGCGLSDWSVPEIGFDTFVTDLEQVVDAAGAEKFTLLGISQGAAVSIEYAVRHPERVSRLILFGGYAAGWRHGATEEETAEREAVMTLTRTGWGRADPTYRRLFSQTFMPSATLEELDWFDDYQRRTASPENAVRFLEAFSTLDVRDRLAQVRVPTLVVHSRDDRRIPLATGKALAAGIPGARFRTLDSDGHLLIGREPASAEFVAAMREFMAAPRPAAGRGPTGAPRPMPRSLAPAAGPGGGGRMALHAAPLRRPHA